MTNCCAISSLPRVRWTAQAEPIYMPLAQVIYQLRRHDAADGLLLDALRVADIEASSEPGWILDALISSYNQLERKMQILQRTLARVSATIKPVALQLSAPFRQHGSAHVAAVFELSDGQSLSIYFHNPDTTPNKINPDDELISWKWLLNKKDITIVVAPEQGKDLNLLDVATRVIKLAEKNSAAFTRANAKRAAHVEALNQLKQEVEALEKELEQAQQELALVQQEYENAQQQAAKAAAHPAPEPTTFSEVVIPAGLSETELAVLIASLYRKPYRQGVAWEIMPPEDTENYPIILKKLIDSGYLGRAGGLSKKGGALLDAFTERLGKNHTLNDWIDVQKQKYNPPAPKIELNEKLNKAAALLRDNYGYLLTQKNGSLILSSPYKTDEEDTSDELIIEGCYNNAAIISFNKVGMEIADLENNEPEALAHSLHEIISRFHNKPTEYIQACEFLEQGAAEVGLQVHYGDFNASVSGSLFDAASGTVSVIGITAQLHDGHKIWARAQINEIDELNETSGLTILKGAAGDTIVGQAESAHDVANLLRRLMDQSEVADITTVPPDDWQYQPPEKQALMAPTTPEFTAPVKPYAQYLQEASGDTFEAAKAFYKAELQGKIIKTVIGDVWMLGSTWQKFKGDARKKDDIIAELIPYVPMILKGGQYQGKENLYKERKDRYVAFHQFIHEVQIDNKAITVGVSVGERTDGQYEYVVYSLNHSQNESWGKRKAPEHQVLDLGGGPSSVSSLAPSTGGQQPPLDTISHKIAENPADVEIIRGTTFDKVNPETEAAWNIRILKVVDLATDQRLYALEDGLDDQESIQKKVSNKPEAPAAAPELSGAALYAFNETRTTAQRKADNAAALLLLDAIDSGAKNRANLSTTDKAILAKYSGTGGALIGADGKKGSAYEYYTPAPIAAGMWALLKDLGFSGGKVLDPCAGTGVFSATAPDNAAIEAIELNEISGKINQLVNDSSAHHTTIAPFEQVAVATPDEHYDVVISNVPFGGVADRGGNQLLDTKYQKEPLQNYFILRTLEPISKLERRAGDPHAHRR